MLLVRAEVQHFYKHPYSTPSLIASSHNPSGYAAKNVQGTQPRSKSLASLMKASSLSAGSRLLAYLNFSCIVAPNQLVGNRGKVASGDMIPSTLQNLLQRPDWGQTGGVCSADACLSCCLLSFAKPWRPQR
jgi:hypothetical protein